MKSFILKSVFFIALSSLVFACGESAAEKERKRQQKIFKENPIKWDTVRTNMTIPFAHDTLNATYSINVNYIYPHKYQNETANNNLGTKLNQTLWGVEDANFLNAPSLGENAVKEFADMQSAFYRDEMEKRMETWNGINGDSLFNMIENFDTNILYNKANIVSYQVTQEVFQGQNDSIPQIKVTNLVFNLTDGDRLKESDLFINNYTDSLNSILAREVANIIEKNYKDKKNVNKEFWGTKNIGSNHNFYITQDSIIYDFNPLEYNSEKIGILHIPISYKQLESIIKKDGPLNLFLSAQDKTRTK